jgi:hypothetical protein
MWTPKRGRLGVDAPGTQPAQGCTSLPPETIALVATHPSYIDSDLSELTLGNGKDRFQRGPKDRRSSEGPACPIFNDH